MLTILPVRWPVDGGGVSGIARRSLGLARSAREEAADVRCAAVAAASFNSAWPEGYSWEQWDPMVDVTMDNVRTIFPEIFRRRRMGQKDEVLAMDYVGGRRCKTYVYRDARGEHRGRLKLSAGEYEATRGDVERLLRVANELLRSRARPRRA